MGKVRSYRRSLVIFSTTRLLILARVMLFGGYLWPVPAHMAEKVYENQGSSFATYLLTDSSLASNLWFLALLLGVLYLVGLHSVSATHRRHEENQARLRKRAERRKTYEPAQDAGWQEKVEDLAKRAISLDALLTFYSGLGRDYMHNFDSKVHTTDDVVRQAIIPLSALHQSDLLLAKKKSVDMSMLSMKGRRVRPGAMVTHTWHSRFRDLVAACCADGLEESNYLRISLLLDTDMDLIRHWLRRCGELKSTYWICAFCVNQHKGICHPSFPLYDSATGATVKPCECNCPKYLNTDPPCRSDLAHPISINCEMNKFSDMIAWLAATDDEFRQVLVVDANLELFSRAWCMAEIAEAYMMGMKQLLKIESGNALQQRNAKLKALRIEDMKASRAEDVQEILHRIPDKDEFNRQLQRLFGKLFGTFWHLHPSERLKIACRELRWQLHSQEQEDIDGSISSLEENTMPEAKVHRYHGVLGSIKTVLLKYWVWGFTARCNPAFLKPNLTNVIQCKQFGTSEFGLALDPEEVAKACTSSLLHNKELHEAMLIRGQAQLQLGFFAACEMDCSDALKATPDSATASQKCYRDAADDCKRALLLDEKSRLAMATLGAALLKLGDHQAALENCDKAVQYMLALRAKDKSDATDATKKLKKKKSKSKVQKKRSTIKKRQTMSPKAAKAAQSAAAESAESISAVDDLEEPDEDDLWPDEMSPRADTEEEDSPREEESQDPKEQKEETPALSGLFDVIQHLVQNKPDLEAGLAKWEEAQLVPPPPEAEGMNRSEIEELAELYAMRAQAKVALGDLEGTIADCSSALRLNARVPFCWAARAEANRLQEKLDEAVADASEALRLDPLNVFAYLTRAKAKLRVGQFQYVVTDCSEALALDLHQPSAWPGPYWCPG
eukprot:symbB.v1.2.010865.t2/scaffold716.1/size187362/18